jgi:hypothetical protein
VHDILVSSAETETMDAFKPGFDDVILHRPRPHQDIAGARHGLVPPYDVRRPAIFAVQHELRGREGAAKTLPQTPAALHHPCLDLGPSKECSPQLTMLATVSNARDAPQGEQCSPQSTMLAMLDTVSKALAKVNNAGHCIDS